MRVLWISGTPSLASEALGRPPAQGGGWVASLEAALAACEDLDLSIAFPWDVAETRRLAEADGDYLAFPQYPRGGRLRRLLADHSTRLEPDTEVIHLQRAVELTRPDLIHVFGTEAFYGRVAETTDLPVLIELQGLRTQCTEVYCDAFSRWQLLRHGSARQLVKGRSLFHRYYRYRRSAKRERQILADARFVAGRTRWDQGVASVLAPDARYYHCDRILRPPFYRARWRPRARGGELRLVSTLRGNAYKGIETVYRAVELLAHRLPAGVRWTLVGIRPGEEIQHIVETRLGGSFERRGLEPAGRQPAERVAQSLLEGDIYVHPSRIDNSPNGLAEAMLVGLPIVATQVGGIPSLMEDERDGLLVPPGDPWALAGAILRLAANPDLGQRFAEAARDRALRRHDPAAVADTLLGIYRSILAVKG